MLATLIILTISRLHQHISIIGKLRPAMILALGALGYAYLKPKYLAGGAILRERLPRTVIGLLALACISVPFGISIGNSALMIIEAYSKLIVIVLLVMLTVRTVSDLYAYVVAYATGVTILAFFAVFVFQLSQAPQLARLSDLYTWDANDAGLILVTGIPLFLLLAKTGKRVLGGLAWVGLVLCLVALVRTGSRGAFLALLAAGFGVLFLARAVAPATRGALVLAATMGFVLLAPADYKAQMKGILSATEDYNWTSGQGRKELSKRGVGYMLSRPFGLGINNFSKAECSSLSEYFRNRPANRGVKCSAPHNTWVQAGAELGVLGLVAWAAMILGGLALVVRLARRIPKAWARGSPEQQFLRFAPGYLAASLLGFAVGSTFVSFAWQEIGYLLVAFAASTAFLIRRDFGIGPRMARSRLRGAGSYNAGLR
jgi:O-antigen ligase